MRWARLAIFDLSFWPGRESQVGAHAVARREKGRMYPKFISGAFWTEDGNRVCRVTVSIKGQILRM